MIKASIIIPSYNSYLTIARTLDALLEDQSGHIHEIIVVDSSDDHKTREVLSPYSSKKVKTVFLDKKTSPALGRNAGAQQATGDLFLFIDADAYPEPSWAAEIAKAIEAGALVGGGSIGLPPFQQQSPMAAAQFFLQFNEFMQTGSTRHKKFVPSCNLFCEKSLFRRMGGFPDIRASEDVLFGLNASKHSKVWFVPGAKVFHIFRESLRAYLNNQELLGRYILIYRRSYFKRWIYQGIFPLLFFPFFFTLKFIRILLRILGSGNLKYYGLFVISLPLFLLGLVRWSVGFIKGVFSREKFYSR